MSLPRPLGIDIPGDFLDKHYLKTPFSLPGGCRELIDLGNWNTVRHILGTSDTDVVIGRGHERWPGTASPTWEQSRGLFDQGYTIGIRHAEKHEERLGELANQFRAALGGAIDIHLYCTPPGQTGFGWHYDSEEVFVLQTSGSKRWRLRKNTVNPWPLRETMPPNLRFEREIMPLMECLLEAGDWLYLPCGYWHQTHAPQESISLSIGVSAPTALDVFDFLRPKLLNSMRWRQRLAPIDISNEQALELLHHLFRELGQDLAEQLCRPEAAAEFLTAFSKKGQI